MSNRTHSIFLYPFSSGLRPQFTVSRVMTTGLAGPFVSLTIHEPDGATTTLFLRDGQAIEELRNALHLARRRLFPPNPLRWQDTDTDPV